MHTDEESRLLWEVRGAGQVRGFDLTTLQEKVSFQVPTAVLKHQDSVFHTCHCFSSSSSSSKTSILKQYLAVGTSDGRIFVWDLQRGVLVSTLTLPSVPHHAVFSSDSLSLFICLKSSSCVHKFEISSGKETLNLKCGKKYVNLIALNPKAQVIAVASR